MRWLLIVALLAGPAVARRPRGPDPCLPAPKLFISPIGEPFRGPADGPDPVFAWFDGADRDHDGKLSVAEIVVDADRFFATVDLDRSGEILPDELDNYERVIAPEVSIWQGRSALPRQDDRRRRSDGDYGGAMGAGRYGLINVPHPLASADRDYNRAITREELEGVARRAFLVLTPGGSLARSALPMTPQQAQATACADAAAKAKRR